MTTASRPDADGGGPAWIETVPEPDWTGELAELRGAVVDPLSERVDHIMSVHSLNPRGLAAHQAIYASAMRGTPSLRKVERELLAFVVSLENRCHY